MWYMYNWPTKPTPSGGFSHVAGSTGGDSSFSSAPMVAARTVRWRQTVAKWPTLPQCRHRFPDALQSSRGCWLSPQYAHVPFASLLVDLAKLALPDCAFLYANLLTTAMADDYWPVSKSSLTPVSFDDSWVAQSCSTLSRDRSLLNCCSKI